MYPRRAIPLPITTSPSLWIMCDGVHYNGGLLLCTECFTIEEVVKLINMLIIRYGLNPRIVFNRVGPRIIINRSDLALLRSIVEPHMCDFSMCKLSGTTRDKHNKLGA
jgi:hypothetical protein